MNKTKEPTLLARHIDIADLKKELDKTCKKLLSQKIILAWIMKYTMAEYRHYSVHYIMQHFIPDEEMQFSPIAVHRDEGNQLILGSNTEDASITEGTVYYDIRFRALHPHTKQAIAMFINVEAQSDYSPGYPITKRGIYYCCRMISAQYGTVFTGSHYEKIRKVYSVWVCTNPPKYLQNTLSSYEINKTDRIGIVQEPLHDYDLLSMVVLRLCPTPQPQNRQNRLLDMLSILLSPHLTAETKKHILETEFKLPITQEIEEELNTMCNYSDGVEKIAWKRGMKRGIEKGIEKGTFTTLHNLIQSGLISLEEAAKQVNLSVPAFQRKLKELP
ncbi:MAG: hypothetical protein IJN16_00015 [Lachnospiraceae bacterium]|nr:hypothetical protein [Lachnospiraceae bacterium]